MCLITGFINFDDSIEKTLKVLKLLDYRGLDSIGIYYNNEIFVDSNLNKLIKKVGHSRQTPTNADKSRPQPTNAESPTSNLQPPTLGHRLHSIVDFVVQPIEKNENVLISNCEIYNWRELKEKFNLKSQNDAELILDLIELKGIQNLKEIINLFVGPFAFAYFNKKTNEIILARDIIGEKPIYYFYNKKKKQFTFCSEKKGISNSVTRKTRSEHTEQVSESLKNIKELNPREILIYNIKNNKLNFIENKLEYTGYVFSKKYEILKKETFELLEKSILKQVPVGQKLGLLFSGGIDSTFIAYILKKNKIDFTCYTAKLIGGNIKEASDYIYAKEIAKKYNFKLKIAEIHVDNLEKEVKEVIEIIEEREYIKVSVALPFLLSSKLAKKDKVKVLFSGLGSEELFAGYRRHKQVKDVNLECYNGLLTLHSRDLYRDDVICMSQNQEIRLPFLDRKLINYSLQIPVKYKLNLEENRSKIILRDIAKEIGIDEKYSERAKKAAQYGSKFDKGLLRLSKNSKIGKQEYLNRLK